MALITIDEPVGIYYGGTIAAPVIADLFENILPYMGIEKEQKSNTIMEPKGRTSLAQAAKYS